MERGRRRGPHTPSWKYMMASPDDELESAVLALPAAERARLAERLLASLAEDGEVEETWAEEIRRRLEAYRSGQIESVPAKRVIEELRTRLGRWTFASSPRPVGNWAEPSSITSGKDPERVRGS